MALLLLSSFILFAIILRVLVQYYYTGDHGVRFAKTSAPLSEVVPGVTFILSFISSMFLIVLNHLGVFIVDYHFSLLTNFGLGVLGFTGITITVVAQMQMGRSWRIGVDQNEKTELMTGGLYSRSRNPIYFGILLYWLAIALSFPHPAMWTCAAVCWLSIELIVRKIEEPYLRRTHGEVFANYYRRSKRYLIW